MPYYAVGAFGRTAAIAALGATLSAGAAFGWPMGVLGAATLVLWVLYAFLSGIVGVPYNDLVARAVPSEQRSRVLAWRFFGGGLIGLASAAVADRLLRTMPFPLSYAAILGIAAGLMLISSVVFVAMREPPRVRATQAPSRFSTYLREGVAAFGKDRRFRRFVVAQWCGGAALIAAPFYVVAAEGLGIGLKNVAVLLAAQMIGALLSNPLWGWFGDSRGKLALMRLIAALRIFPPAGLVVLVLLQPGLGIVLPIMLMVFFALGAIQNGVTIAVIGLLMEISPEDRRPAYSGYFNAMTAPAFAIPLLGGVAYAVAGPTSVFVLAGVAAAAQFSILSPQRLQ